MLFNSFQYLLFLPVVVVVYYVLPVRMKSYWLLAASYYFYMNWNPVYVVLLLFCTLTTWLSGMIIEKLKSVKNNSSVITYKKICLGLCIIANLGILFFYKYSSMVLGYMNVFLEKIGINMVMPHFSYILPVGISFYMLQSIGYLLDVYRDDVSAERNFFDYALFVSFFPQLVAGPIERSKNLLTQLKQKHSFNYANIQKGTVLILYGLFLKMVIADNLAIVVDTVYGNYVQCPGLYIVIATFFFALQIYCDFYGYSTIARGSALLLGIGLMENFNAPYFSQSIKEFWRRWHISLSGWFKDYLYIPLGGNRHNFIRSNFNLLFVFMVSGLWHGASLAFVFWGALNGVYQVIHRIIKRIVCFAREKIYRITYLFDYIEKGQGLFCRQLLRTAVTFVLVSFTWLFFRAGELKLSIQILKSMVLTFNYQILLDGSLFNLGVSKGRFILLLAAICVVGFIDYLKYQGRKPLEIIMKQDYWFRLGVITIIFCSIILLGCYGDVYDSAQFIYFQF